MFGIAIDTALLLPEQQMIKNIERIAEKLVEDGWVFEALETAKLLPEPEKRKEMKKIIDYDANRKEFRFLQ